MLGYIREANTPKEAWENLKKIFAVNTTARKIQLHQDLNNVQQRDMSITSYTLKNKELCDSLASINVNVDGDEMVQICLDALAPQFDTMRTTSSLQEKILLPSTFSRCYDVTGQKKPRSNEEHRIGRTHALFALKMYHRCNSYDT